MKRYHLNCQLDHLTIDKKYALHFRVIQSVIRLLLPTEAHNESGQSNPQQLYIESIIDHRYSKKKNSKSSHL